jgi:FAD/FMN-containing dehydrogenase
MLRWSPWLRRRLLAIALGRTPPEDVVGTGWQLLANTRETRFNEMEYHLPPHSAFDALRDLIAWIETHRREVFFPVEVRKTAADDAWLSPFQGGSRISIAVHAHASDPHDWFFDGPEQILRAAGGRPHWGKLHSLTAADLVPLYPDFERFVALRRELDPAGVFLTPACARLWGES